MLKLIAAENYAHLRTAMCITFKDRVEHSSAYSKLSLQCHNIVLLVSKKAVVCDLFRPAVPYDTPTLSGKY